MCCCTRVSLSNSDPPVVGHCDSCSASGLVNMMLDQSFLTVASPFALVFDELFADDLDELVGHPCRQETQGDAARANANRKDGGEQDAKFKRQLAGPQRVQGDRILLQHLVNIAGGSIHLLIDGQVKVFQVLLELDAKLIGLAGR